MGWQCTHRCDYCGLRKGHDEYTNDLNNSEDLGRAWLCDTCYAGMIEAEDSGPIDGAWS